MNKCRICESEIPSKIVIDGKRRSMSSRKFCLVCSPWGKHNTADLTKKLAPIEDREKKCPKCKETKNLNQFYKRRKSGEPSVYCKICTNNDAMGRQRLFKQECISYKGGKCEMCGYNKSVAALEFHPTEPLGKDFSISHARTWKFDTRIKDELDKCQLLCRNCHAEEHVRLNDLKYGAPTRT